jgi:hypothetical protein
MLPLPGFLGSGSWCIEAKIEKNQLFTGKKPKKISDPTPIVSMLVGV